MKKKEEDICNNNSQNFKNLCQMARIKYSDYIRTTEQRHKESVCSFWNELKSRNKLVKSTYSGYYSITDEAFMSKSDLIYLNDKKTYVTEQFHPVEFITEQNYKINFIPEIPKLKEKIDKEEIRFFPYNIINEVKEYINQNLNELSISRPKNRVYWGIPVPGEEDKHTIYVWFEALINYITVLGICHND